MSKFLLPAGLAFGAIMALIIGQRMSAEAMAVVIGVAAGVAASVPTSLILIALLRRKYETTPERAQEFRTSLAPFPQMTGQPPVIVLDPYQLVRQNQQAMPLPPPSSLLPEDDGGVHPIRIYGDERWQSNA